MWPFWDLYGMTKRSLSVTILLNANIGAWLLCAALAVLILIWQAFVWLRYGYWQPVTVWSLMLQSGLNVPEVPWLGVQKMFFWMIDQSAVLFLAGCSVGFFWLGIWVTQEEHRT
jgi:hypothetical protein